MFSNIKLNNRVRTLLTMLLVTGAALFFFLAQPFLLVTDPEEPVTAGREKTRHALAEPGGQTPHNEDKPVPDPAPQNVKPDPVKEPQAQPQPKSAPQPRPAQPLVQPQTPPREQVPAGAPAPAGKAGMWVDVDLSDQQVVVKQGDQTVKTMVTSSGAPGADTPRGVFEVQNRGEWFYSPKYQEGAKWWVSFKGWGKYLFHSVVMDENQQVIQEEAEKLGSPASHGCLRLAEKDAQWIYQNVPQGTRVVIHP